MYMYIYVCVCVCVWGGGGGTFVVLVYPGKSSKPVASAIHVARQHHSNSTLFPFCGITQEWHNWSGYLNFGLL